MLESALEMAQCVLYMTSVSSLVTAALTVRIATTVCSQAVKQSSSPADSKQCMCLQKMTKLSLLKKANTHAKCARFLSHSALQK